MHVTTSWRLIHNKVIDKAFVLDHPYGTALRVVKERLLITAPCRIVLVTLVTFSWCLLCSRLELILDQPDIFQRGFVFFML